MCDGHIGWFCLLPKAGEAIYHSHKKVRARLVTEPLSVGNMWSFVPYSWVIVPDFQIRGFDSPLFLRLAYY